MGTSSAWCSVSAWGPRCGRRERGSPRSRRKAKRLPRGRPGVAGDTSETALRDSENLVGSAERPKRGNGELSDDHVWKYQGSGNVGQGTDGESVGGFPQRAGDGTHRARQRGAARQRTRGLSRNADAGESAGNG